MLSADDKSRILASVRADNGFMQEFINDFLNDIPQDVAQLEQAIMDRDTHKTEHVAHGLKSVIGLFQAMTAYEIARDIESLGKEGSFAEARAKFNELVPAIEDLKLLLSSANV